MSKFGSASVWFLVGGYNMIVNKLQGLRGKVETLTEPTHGLGDSWEEQTPIGMSKAEVAQEGAFFQVAATSDTTTMYLFDMLSTTGVVISSTDAAKVVCMGFSGETTGEAFIGFNGEFNSDYEVLAKNGKLTRVNANYKVTGNAEHGTIIRPNVATTTSVTYYQDNGAATTNGGAAYIQANFTNLVTTGITITVSDCATSGGGYVAIGTVTTTGTGAWRVATTDNTVDRWLSGAVAVTSSGVPSLTCFIGYSRV